MNRPVQPGAGTRDGGAFVRRVSVTESRAQSANFACHPSDRSLHVSLTSSDSALSAVVMTRDALCPLAPTLGGSVVSSAVSSAVSTAVTPAVSTVAAPATAALDTPASAPPTRSLMARHRLHLRHFHRNAPIWDPRRSPGDDTQLRPRGVRGCRIG